MSVLRVLHMAEPNVTLMRGSLDQKPARRIVHLAYLLPRVLCDQCYAPRVLCDQCNQLSNLTFTRNGHWRQA